MVRIPPLFGQCKRCTRTSKVAALCAWVIAVLVLVVSRRLDLALAACLTATCLTALWVAHLAAVAYRGTLAGMLRQFGAEPGEARAIVAALGRQNGRLKEGEAVSVRRAERPGRPGFRLTRVAISNDQAVIAAAGITEAGSYEKLDPRGIEAGQHD